MSEVLFRPGQAILVSLRLYNVRGVERSAPTEFVRAAADGKPALRRGVSLVLNEHPKDERPRRPSIPRRAPETDADAAVRSRQRARTLAPTESFEAVRLDLNDWYGELQPGRYWLELTFGADSGIGEGTTNQIDIEVLGHVEVGR